MANQGKYARRGFKKTCSTPSSSRSPWIGSSYARRLHVEALEDRRMLAVFTVTNNGDSGAGSLRDAITQANTMAGADTINFDAGVFSGGDNSLIRLTSGELMISDTLTIDGTTGADVTITGDADDDDITDARNITNVAASGDALLDDNSRVLNFSSATGDLTLQSLTLTGGRTTDNYGPGGGILFGSTSTLLLTNSNVSGNSTVGNSANGGGISNSNGTVTLTRSTVSGNSTAGELAYGGGIYTGSGPVTLTNSTLSGNSTSGLNAKGGGIYAFEASIELTGSTVAGNRGAPGPGGGIYVLNGSMNDSFTLNNTIVAGNTDSNGSPSDLRPGPGSTLSVDYSLIGNTSGSGISGTTGTGNVLNQNPLLGPLADNGGTTMTHALLPGSPAIDTGNIRVAVPGVFGTGLDANRNLLADDQDDPHYDIVAQPNSGTLTDATLVQDGFPIGPWVSNNTTSRWIGPNTDNAVGPAGEYTYQTEFDLTGFIESTAFLSGNWASDNSASIWINGVDAEATTAAKEFGALQPFTDPSPFVYVPGINVLEFRVTNGGVADSPTGLRVDDLSVTAEPITVDQRGFSRNGILPDIGAYERQAEETTTLVVSTNTDIDDGNHGPGQLSLREAIGITNLSPGDDTINFDAGVFSGENNSLIQLTGGELEITDTLTIDAAALTDNVTIDAQLNSRVLNFSSTSGNLTLAGLTVTRGRTTAGADGGGILFNSSDTITLLDSLVTDNATGIGGNGNFGEAGGDGGGIFTADGNVTLTNSTVSGNSTGAGGTGFEGGSGGDGGGIRHFSGTVTLTNSTISGNFTGSGGAGGFGGYGGDGGGIDTYAGSVSLHNSTVSGNAAARRGGGVFVYNYVNNLPIVIENSIIAGNTDDGTAPDLQPDPDSTLDIDFSLIGSTDLTISGTGNQVGTLASPIEPLLGPLADNGGPTMTHALMPSSPAIDAGNSTFTTDQRGLAVPVDLAGVPNAAGGNGSDIGAYEVQFVPADLNQDGFVDGLDLGILLGNWGQAVSASEGELSGMPPVDGLDLGILLGAWNPPPAPLVGSAQSAGGSANVIDEGAIDAALALEWLNSEDDHLAPPRVAAKPPAMVVDVAVEQKFDLPAAISATDSRASIERSTGTKLADAPWLAEELLERVFG